MVIPLHQHPLQQARHRPVQLLPCDGPDIRAVDVDPETADCVVVPEMVVGDGRVGVLEDGGLDTVEGGGEADVEGGGGDGIAEGGYDEGEGGGGEGVGDVGWDCGEGGEGGGGVWRCV